MKEFEPNSFCKSCGNCCKSMPGSYTAKDILRIFGSIKAAVESGKVAIDWWEGNKPLYYMRPKVAGVSKLYDPSWGGRCIHLTDNGCELTRDKMPTHCKTLRPMEKQGGDCVQVGIKKHNEKYRAAMSFKRAKINLSGLSAIESGEMLNG